MREGGGGLYVKSYVHVCVCMCMYICVCLRERERERDLSLQLLPCFLSPDNSRFLKIIGLFFKIWVSFVGLFDKREVERGGVQKSYVYIYMCVFMYTCACLRERERETSVA